MKKLLIMMLSLFCMGNGFAQKNVPLHPFLLVKINFNYSIPLEGAKSQVNSLQNMTKINMNDNEWKVIGRSQSLLKGDTLIVLAKLDQANSETAKMKFLIIDLIKEENIIMETKINLHYNKQEKLSIKKHGRQLQLSVLTTRDKAE
ncbi:MAG: hypothetical protein A3F11_09145 [Gammaproteobacteria bacterium RIFCSPHIGHO2_12_FULL_37_14]|nr:MAG: hypothetical protein A3F11_09145 [Gammaproteobacteria bacterium RIFCSPHIGHO2_12_FULL_37_14]